MTDWGTHVADHLKKSTTPLQSPDLDWYEEALALGLEEIWTLTADTEDELPGWSILVDSRRCPDEYLPWLAQMAGVPSYVPGETLDQLRARVTDAESWERGTPLAIQEAAQRMGLTTFLLQERTPGAWNVRFLTSTAEYTAEKMAQLAAYLPAGITWVWDDWTGYLYMDPITTTYADRKTKYPLYKNVTAYP